MLKTDSLNLLMLGSGLLGGFGHCAGMCGPLVAAWSLNLGSTSCPQSSSPSLAHLLYNLGRVTTYSVIGGIMGLTGSFAGVVRSIESFQDLSMAALGLLMIIMGLASSGWLSFSGKNRGSSAQKGITSVISRAVNRMIRFISGTNTTGSFYAIGLATGFIPCGLLYTAYIAAAGAGAGAHSQAEGFLKGMLMLFLFGLGTTPALFLIGRVVALKGEWIRSRLYSTSSLFMIITGAILIYRAFRR
jgi:sulfite exporter TauE/SafE